MAITIFKGVASFTRSHASPPYKYPNEENAPSSRTSKGSSLNKERSNKRASRDGEDVGLSKGSTWHIPYFPFPLDLAASLYCNRSPCPFKICIPSLG